jgi:phosphatidylglycerol---prolipoprotein diacylglyceryl transferase
MFPILRLGPFSLQTAGLVLLLSFAAGSSLAEREARRLGLSPSIIGNGIFVALVAGLVGARLVYAARYLSSYLANPADVLSLNPSALAVPEGLVIGALAGLFYWWIKDLPLRRALDAVALPLAVMALGLGVAHLAAGNAYGAAARLPWSIYLWDDYRHPSQVYEILAAVVVFAILWHARKPERFPGFLFLMLLALSGASRLILESFRGDSTLVFGGLRAAQVGALAVLLVSLWLMGRWASGATLEASDGESEVGERPDPILADPRERQGKPL